MSDNKKYYYLKLKENFFDREEIKVIRGMDKGDTYINIMLEMYLRSLKRGGSLMMTDTIPFNLQTLSAVLSRDADEVKYAIDLFTQFKLVDMLETGEIFMTDIQNFIGHGSSEAERKAQYRKKIKEASIKAALGHCPDVRPPEIEIELETELKLETNTTPTPSKGKRFVAPSVDQVKEYCQEKGYAIDPEAYCDFYASKGWMVGKNKMKDWKAAVRNAHRNGYFRANQTPQNNSNSIEGFKWGQN